MALFLAQFSCFLLKAVLDTYLSSNSILWYPITMSRYVKYFDCPSWSSISVMSCKDWTSPIVFSFMRWKSTTRRYLFSVLAYSLGTASIGLFHGELLSTIIPSSNKFMTVCRFLFFDSLAVVWTRIYRYGPWFEVNSMFYCIGTNQTAPQKKKYFLRIEISFSKRCLFPIVKLLHS
jgi:hypothetical protein